MFSWPTRLLVAQRNITKRLNQKVARQKNVFFLSSDELVQICMTLSRWFSHKTTAFSAEQCTSPSLFLQLWSLTRQFKPVTEELWLHLQCHFFFTCMHAHKSLNNITELEIWLRAWRQGVDSVFEQSLVNDSSANLHTCTEEVYEDRLAALW